ncbi:MAG TPA: MerR family transcriptional regulator [Polyangiales bacterium]|nr:MerR family transcriptional regulator [Polyangiales bacterium]
MTYPLLHKKRPQAEPATAARPEALGGEAAASGLDLQNLRVGDLAKRTNKTVRALHLYEEHGLLTPAQRSSGGYRLYGRDAELRVRWIDKLQQMGFSLTDIKHIVHDVDNSGPAPTAMHRVHELFREKLSETREQLRRLSALEEELDASLTYLQACDGCETEKLLSACHGCERHDCNHPAPELVLGFRV